ncbi:uncharacterized protein KQ657_003008 [Scheffersomyces spartinae]|uniref:MHD domain-containing protein n=1 Tax=Scheffersomyces spartinae TaxID=45513 RepID=A0A9P7V592_9ASCO|nr:uncharacterized protein KQ657_003008 [Scheffersomyces spartinae]KAG7191613.1 hypothetical protein KQ657_003008 [Scheffersomyces spartinae]
MNVLITKLYREGIRRNVGDVFRIQVINNQSVLSGSGGGGSAGRRGSSGTQALEVRSPVLTLGSTSFVYIKTGQIWLCAVARSNQDCSLILEFLFKLKVILQSIIVNWRTRNGGNHKAEAALDLITGMKSDGTGGGINGDDKDCTDGVLSSGVIENTELTSHGILALYSLVYDVLDEIVEFGFPIDLDWGFLKQRFGINKESSKSSLSRGSSRMKMRWGSSSGLGGGGSGSSSGNGNSKDKTSLSSNDGYYNENRVVPWRQTGIKYRRNEIFLNVQEHINMLMTAEGEILRGYVNGKIMMKCKLLGMPVCRFGLNDNAKFSGDVDVDDYNDDLDVDGDSRVELDDCRFHDCVELQKFHTEKMIEFIPPDGEFQLMSYQCNRNVQLPFEIHTSAVEQSNRLIKYLIRLSSLFSLKISATNVSMKIPVPATLLKSELFTSASGGNAKYVPEDLVVDWNFGKFYGGQDHYLNLEVSTSTDSDQLACVAINSAYIHARKPPIRLSFHLNMFSCLGLQVKYLRVNERSNYRTVKWVKYSSNSGNYEVRV